jgi:hypothetical protein
VGTPRPNCLRGNSTTALCNEGKKGTTIPEERKRCISENNSQYWTGKERSPETLEKVGTAGRAQDHSYRWLAVKMVKPEGEIVVIQAMRVFLSVFD